MIDNPPTTIGITGANGLLGTHLRALLHVERGVTVMLAGRETFADGASLRGFAERCDAIVHFAGLNRGDESDVERVNVELAEALAEACDATGSRAQLVFSSSTHISRPTAYGRAKLRAAQILGASCARRGAPFANLILPHIFGEGGKPFHNSVVSTFCRQIATGESPTIDVDGELELLHASDVARLAREAIRTHRNGEERPAGKQLRVSQLLRRLRAFDAEYRSDGTIPHFEDVLDRDLFNTLRTELYYVTPIRDLMVRSDARGDLFETVKTRGAGQSFVSTTKPAVTRGNHFHFKKLERFIVLRGQARITVRPLFSSEARSFDVSGLEPQFVDMPTLHPHNITNIGSDELVTQFWTDEIFDPAAPDTYPETVA